MKDFFFTRIDPVSFYESIFELINDRSNKVKERFLKSIKSHFRMIPINSRIDPLKVYDPKA